MFRHSRSLLFMLMAALPLAASAGGVATLQSGKSTDASDVSRFEWLDLHTIRAAQGSTDYTLVLQGKPYMVDMRGAKPTVIDWAASRREAAAMGRSMGTNKPDFLQHCTFTPTGRSETLAGITGHVYRMSWVNEDGKPQTEDAVLTDNPQVVEMTQAYLSMMDALFGDARGTAELRKSLPHESGFMRIGDEFHLVSISDKTPAASDFRLPAKPMTMMQAMKSRMHP